MTLLAACCCDPVVDPPACCVSADDGTFAVVHCAATSDEDEWFCDSGDPDVCELDHSSINVSTTLPANDATPTAVSADLCWDGTKYTGIGVEGDSWSVYVEVDGEDGSDCLRYRVTQAVVLFDGNTFEFLYYADSGDIADCGVGPDAYALSTSNPDLFDAFVCQSLVVTAQGGALLPFDEGDEPAVSVTLSGASGDCCSDLNTTHSLTLNSSSLEPLCDRWHGSLNYTKIIPITVDCNGKLISMDIAQTNYVLNNGMHYCTVVITVQVYYKPSSETGCYREWSKEFCPVDPNDLSFDLSELVLIDSSDDDCGDDCSFSGLTLTGTVTLD